MDCRYKVAYMFRKKEHGEHVGFYYYGLDFHPNHLFYYGLLYEGGDNGMVTMDDDEYYFAHINAPPPFFINNMLGIVIDEYLYKIITSITGIKYEYKKVIIDKTYNFKWDSISSKHLDVLPDSSNLSYYDWLEEIYLKACSKRVNNLLYYNIRPPKYENEKISKKFNDYRDLTINDFTNRHILDIDEIKPDEVLISPNMIKAYPVFEHFGSWSYVINRDIYEVLYPYLDEKYYILSEVRLAAVDIDT